MLLRRCNGPGCYQEQEVSPGDKVPFQADRPWITTVWEAVTPFPMHFCSRECHNLYTAPPMKGITVAGKVVLGADPRDFKRSIKSPSEPWDPKSDPPFGPITPGEPAPV